MKLVNMHEAKTNLSRLVDDIESGRESEIMIARRGRPAVRLVPLLPDGVTRPRLGVARGAFRVPAQSEEVDREVAALFAAEPPPQGEGE